MLNIRKVVVGISGGVDSAVTAFLLKQKGYNVQGVFMQNWDIADEKGFCQADADYKDASVVCNKLEIPLMHVNFVKHYWNEVFCDLINDYENGFTPNPDILCNKNVKFNHFYRFAINDLKADAIATGHYARTSFGPYLENYEPDKAVRLFCAKDTRKDQTFFLCQVHQEALRKTMFPLGNLTKTQVKQIANENGFEKIAQKKESMGICFIGSRNFPHFIREYIADKPGFFIDVDKNKKVGEHIGIHQWTLGQRSRLPGVPQAYFIGTKDVSTNNIYVVQGTKHPLLYTNTIFTSSPHWIHSQPLDLKMGNLFECEFKFQHTQSWIKANVMQTDKGLVIWLGRQKKRAVTPGQFAVLKKGDEFLGSARIVNEGVSHFSLYYLENNKIRKVSDIINKYCTMNEDEENLKEEN